MGKARRASCLGAFWAAGTRKAPQARGFDGVIPWMDEILHHFNIQCRSLFTYGNIRVDLGGCFPLELRIMGTSGGSFSGARSSHESGKVLVVVSGVLNLRTGPGTRLRLGASTSITACVSGTRKRLLGCPVCSLKPA